MIYLIYILVGFIINVLAILDIKATIHNKISLSIIVDVTADVLWFFVLVNLVLSQDKVYLLLAYILGKSIGTIFTFKSKLLRSYYVQKD